jgi:hypothetical protein
MVPPMLCTSWRRVVSDGGYLTVVVVVGACVVVDAFAVVVGPVVAPVDDVAFGFGFGFDESEPPSAAMVATARPATVSTHTAAITAIRAPGRRAGPGVTTIRATVPSRPMRMRPGGSAPREHLLVIDDVVRLLERAEQLADRGELPGVRQTLTQLVDTVDVGSPRAHITRGLDLATRTEAHDLALHYALTLWCASPGKPNAYRKLTSVALHHDRPAVAKAGFRMFHHRVRAVDWSTLAAADPHGTWPQIRNLCDAGPHGPRTLAELVAARRARSVAADRDTNSDGRRAWVVGDARVTRCGKSVAIGAHDPDAKSPDAYVPALGITDCSAALRWTETKPDDTYSAIGLLGTRFSYSGYWHWLMEGLLQAVRLEEAGLLEQLDRLMICADATGTSYLAASLEAVGIAPSKTVITADSFDVVVDQLVVPERASGFGGIIEEFDPGGVRSAMLKNARANNHGDIQAVRRRLGIGPSRRGGRVRRLLISRQDAAKRRVTNETALEAALRVHGFETIVPGALSFTQQVEAFASAECVVGPHGAGLANLLFMSPGSRVLELQHFEVERPHFRRLADTLGLRYEYLRCEADPTSPGDMLVDTDDANAIVRNLLMRA